MLKLRILAFTLLALFSAVFLPDRAGAREAPLLEEGKKTIFQRVISHPGAALYARPGDEKPTGDIAPFTVMYVYERQNQGEATWLKVAANTTGQDQAWVPGDKTSEWKQSLVLLFAERAGREPLIFFNSADDLKTIAGQGGIAAAMSALGREFQAYIRTGTPPPADMPAKAMEPPDEEGAVPYNRFYLMPIFSYEEPFEGVKLLEVGSIDPGTPEEAKAPAGVKNAVAFVIDTTISMGPYIEESLGITRAIYDEVTRLGQGDNVALGMVAFRSSMEAVRGLEYTTKRISPLRTANDRAAFEEALRQVREARVSTHNFNEDSGAGLKAAIEELDWEPYVGRIIILITDAGPLEIVDPYQSTMMTNQAIADLAKAKNIRIVTVHIKSPGGGKNHQYAQAAYQELSPPGGNLSTYLPLDAPTPEEGAANFGVTVKNLASSLSAALFGTADGAAPEDGGEAGAMGRALGYSIKLDYLGQSNQSRAPSVIRSWIADRDLGRLDESLGAGRREVPTVQPAVLLSKDQLSFLSRQLEIIITEAERGMKSDTDIFRNILSASSQVAVDPDVYVKKPNANLVELGVLGEFLEGLPYKSDAMILTEGDWKAMNTGQQHQFVARLKSLVARYKEYDKDLDNWGKFGNPNPGDWLYRVPLNMLP